MPVMYSVLLPELLADTARLCSPQRKRNTRPGSQQSTCYRNKLLAKLIESGTICL